MTLRKIIKTGILTLLFGGLSLTSHAQFDDAGAIISAGTEDANTILKEYFKPVGRGFGPNLNSGWFNTAKPHKVLGFDVTVNVTLAKVPTADQLFDVRDLQLNAFEHRSGEESPTSFGNDESGQVIQSKTIDPTTGQPIAEIQLPQGAGFNWVPTPMAQVTVGIINDTDISLRYLPKMGIPGAEGLDLRLFGIGAKHSINGLLPAGNKLPIDIVAQAGYTSLSATTPFNVDPESGADIENNFQDSHWDGQEGEFSANAFTFNALVGKTLPILSVYAGVGFETSSVDIKAKGNYPVTTLDEDPTTSPTQEITDITDPINLSYDGANSLHGIVGARIRLLILNVSASYTLAEYPVARLGVGISIR